MRDTTLSELERFQPAAPDQTLQMDQDTFGGFYERTARPVWAYLWRRTGDPSLADDLLQETYYRFLRARVSHESEMHRRNYLFKVAANLVNDNHRSRRDDAPLPEDFEKGHPVSTSNAGRRQTDPADLDRALAKLSHRQRDALWLAYAQGSSHIEIAVALGLKVGSVKLILFRARKKLARRLRGSGSAS